MYPRRFKHNANPCMGWPKGKTLEKYNNFKNWYPITAWRNESIVSKERGIAQIKKILKTCDDTEKFFPRLVEFFEVKIPFNEEELFQAYNIIKDDDTDEFIHRRILDMMAHYMELTIHRSRIIKKLWKGRHNTNYMHFVFNLPFLCLEDAVNYFEDESIEMQSVIDKVLKKEK